MLNLFSDLQGKFLVDVWQGEHNYNDAIYFETLNDGQYVLTHVQDCCESVYIESIVGELSDLVGRVVTLADESINYSEDGADQSATWTFYRLASVRGYVDIRFCGTSNGYYSESVDFFTVDM